MKKKVLLVTLLAAAMICGCAKNETKPAADTAPAEVVEDTTEEEAPEEQEEANVGMQNPWVDCDEDTILQKLGFEMKAPEGSKNVSYQMNESEGIGQMMFTYGEPEQDYTYRMKSTAAFEDISGMYYTWDVQDDCKISWCEGKTMRAKDGDKTVDVCLWYDVVPGLMYSLSTEAADLDGFDITAIASQVFVPAQGEVDGDGAEEFMPCNFLEAKVGKDIFTSFDEIIDALDENNAYATVKIMGCDDDVLVISEGTYDNGDGKMAAIDASFYRNDNGTVKCIGNAFSEGTAYPISVDADGRIFSGGNHTIDIEAASQENGNLMVLVYAYESFDEQQNVTYGGFVRQTNSLSDDGVDIAEDDGSVLPGLYEQYMAATPINFTVVK